MPLADTLRDSLVRSFALYRDLIDSLDDPALGSRLPQLPSSPLGQQLWCVVGARESYGRSIREGEWAGFSCSLASYDTRANVAAALRGSESPVLEALRTMETFTDAQNRFLVDLLEHETAHHGQLIRYLYGLRLAIPQSWKSKYALK